MKIACLGSGKMGTALLKGFVTQGLCAPHDITISDSSPITPGSRRFLRLRATEP